MKIGDLVKFAFYNTEQPANRHVPGYERLRKMGVITGFDKDDDPVVLWCGAGRATVPEANYRSHVELLSEA